MKKKVFIFAFLMLSFLKPLWAQEPDSIRIDLFSLYENASDQEGMFYLPEVKRFGPFSDNKILNEKRLQAATRNKNFRAASITANNLAWIELENGNAGKAITYLNIALDARNQLHDYFGAAAIYLQMGFVHYRSLEYETALTDFNKGLTIMKERNFTSSIPVTYALIAQIYLVQKDFDKALINYEKAYSGFEAAKDKRAQARIAIQISEIAIRKQDNKSALKNLKFALDYFKTVNDKSGSALSYRDLGIIKFKQGDLTGAISDFNNSLSLSSQLSVAKLLKNTYFRLLTIKSLAGEFEKSNEINITYVQLRDSIDQVERSRVLSSQMLRRDLMEKETIQEMLSKDKDMAYQQLSAQELERNKQLTEAELDRLEKEKIIEDLSTAMRASDQSNVEREEKIQELTRQKDLQDAAISKKELQISRQETLRNTLITAVLFSLVIGLLLFNRYRQQKKSHNKLNTAYSDLRETHDKLLATQEQLVHAQKMASLGELTAGIAHEIQNPLNFVNNFSELSIEMLQELNDPGVNKEELLNDIATNLKKINQHGKRADKIVKGMLVHSRVGSNEKQPADINDMIDELLELSYHGNRNKENNLSVNIIRDFQDNIPEVYIITNDISRVLVNLFNNSFYALAKKKKESNDAAYTPELKVKTSVVNNHVEITIRDNGSGIPESVQAKIFEPFFTTKPAGEGTGLGLSLSYEIITKGHGGTLKVTSKQNQYTEFTIILPVGKN